MNTEVVLPQHTCHGLTAEWLTGWMAAVGVTVIDPNVRLAWTEDHIPVATFTHLLGDDPVRVLAEGWDQLGRRLEAMPGHRDAGANKKSLEFVGMDAFASNMDAHRGHPDEFSLSSSLTDLRWYRSGRNQVATYGPFETRGPGTTKWAHHRCLKAWRTVKDPLEALRNIFGGTSERVETYGLGWDADRLPAVRDVSKHLKPMVDPVAETLAYFGLALFPVRGEGKQHKTEKGLQRGWVVGPYREGEFIWPAWRQPLGRWGIDALLTAWHGTWRRKDAGKWKAYPPGWEGLGVHTAWKSVSYRSGSDYNSGYGSKRISPE